MAAVSAERAFVVVTRGQTREQILRFYREWLRNTEDPETGATFTDEVISEATGPSQPLWVEADAVDAVCMILVQNGAFLAQQIRIDRAGTAALEDWHGPELGESRLPASSSSGTATANAQAGEAWVGSTELGDPLAARCRDQAGSIFQVFDGGITPSSGVIQLTLLSVTTGAVTQIAAGTELTWVVNQPVGAAPTAVAASDFAGGYDAETDAEFAQRLLDLKRYKQGAGNWAQMRAWARRSTVALSGTGGGAWVYPCALHTGSTQICVLDRRGTTEGPTARVASLATLVAVSSYLIPVASPVVPDGQFIQVVTAAPELSDCVLHLSQSRGNAGGWTDRVPFPTTDPGGTAAAVTLVSSQTDVQITLATGAGQLPGGASSLTGSEAPSLMVWRGDVSQWEALAVDTVTDLGAGVYQVELTAPPAHTLAVGDWFSPAMGRQATLATAAVGYFDTLGPGEVVDLAANDARTGRAFRRPKPEEEAPQRAGQSLITYVGEALGASLADATLASISASTPSVPASATLGPSFMALGKLAVYVQA